MPRQEVTYSFPHEDEDDTEALEIEKSSAKYMDDPDFAKGSDDDDVGDDDDDIEIEVVDDTPEEDRGREKSDPPDDLTEEELRGYSEKVRKRINRFAKGYHDERREKEKAFRERQELEALAKQLYSENQKLKDTSTKSQTALLEQAKRTVANELNVAKYKYKKAHEAGDVNAILAAEEALANARTKLAKVNSITPESLQGQNVGVKSNSEPQQPQVQKQEQQPQVPVDKKAAAWADKNQWFGQDEEMTSFAYGYHQKLVKSGVSPTSEEYYEKIDTRMRQVFPENFQDDGGRTQKRSVVAPPSRSRAPRKVRLTNSQLSIAKKLGVTPEQYAKELAMTMRKENG